MVDLKERMKHEVEHGEFLASHGAEDVWNWASPAGGRRAKRRAGFFLEHLRPGVRALELGCGTGYFTRLCAPSGAEIVATDISDRLLKAAREQTKDANVTYEIADGHALQYENGSFDLVFGSSILHHLEIDIALKEIARVLKPGGRMVFAEPNMLNPQIVAERKIPWLRKKLGVSPDETAFVRFLLAPRMKAAGFSAVEVTPHDFLHPATPEAFIDVVVRASRMIERIPLVREIAGSLRISGIRN
jgi:ubiquinone/menaquinone biosynthesis C-methylase UbiE